MALTASELLLVIKAKDQASAVLDKVGQNSNALGKTLAKVGKIGVTAIAGITAATVAGGVGMLAYGVHAAKAAGRVDELAIVNEVLARNAGIAHDEMRAAVQAVRDKGIEAAASESAVAKLIQAELDLAKASDLARVAQDAAVISNSNSTEAYEALIHGITTMNPLVLRNQGIVVNAVDAYDEYGAAIGKAGKDLTSAEKQAAMFNAVLEKGAAISGAYEAAMKNPIKQLGSMKRLFNDIAVGVGEPFLELFSKIIAKFSSWLKVLGDAVKEGGRLRPTLDRIARGMDMLLSAASRLFDSMVGGFDGLLNIFSDLALRWTGDILSLIAQAANWGANIVESFAGGMQGSGAVSRALRNIGNTITTWLMPGSPPKLLPHLDTWGQGAAESWLAGWAAAAKKTGPFLRKLQTSLGSFLEKIHLGKDISPESITSAFGSDAPLMKRYLGSYRNVATAVSAVETAKEELAAAEEKGDEEAIEAAKEKLQAAEEEEKTARRAMRTQEKALTSRLRQEQRVADAIIQRAEAEVKAARDSERLADEARQRAVEQAYLQYRLAVAGTAAAQIPIWEEELAKVEQGTAEFWQIQTRLVELRRAAEKAAQGVGAGVGTGISDGIRAGVEEGSKDGTAYADSGAHVEQGLGKIDWAGIGKAIGGRVALAIADGIRKLHEYAVGVIVEWSIKFQNYVASTEFGQLSARIGSAIGGWIGKGIRDWLTGEKQVKDLSNSLIAMLLLALDRIRVAALNMGLIIGTDIGIGIGEGLTGREATEEQRTSLHELTRRILEGLGTIRGLGVHAVPRAAGGIINEPLTLVGERGPELISAPRGSRVHTAQQTQQMMGSTYNVTVNIAGDANRKDVEIGVIRGLQAVGIGV